MNKYDDYTGDELYAALVQWTEQNLSEQERNDVWKLVDKWLDESKEIGQHSSFAFSLAGHLAVKAKQQIGN